MFSLFLRNLFFTILQPGIVAGLVPWWIIGVKGNHLFPAAFVPRHYFGTILFIIGLMIMLSCIINFAVKGKGTLSPVDPTKELVVTGLYRFSRNPMYIGVMMILAGEAVFFQSGILCIYASFVFIAFNIFILLHEEPRLESAFGDSYKSYCKKVRRWL